MELLIELVFRGLIINFLGINARYFFFRLIGKKINRSDLKSKGDENQDDWYQDFLNGLAGLLVICLLSMGLAYLGGAWGN